MSISKQSLVYMLSLVSLIPQDATDEDVSLFDAEEDAGQRSKKTSIK